MLRKCTRYIFLLLLAILMIPSGLYFANNTDNVTISNAISSTKINTADEDDDYVLINEAGYIITNYNIDMVVLENNVMQITETITCDFQIKSHGIYRDIPLVNKVVREDKSKSSYVAEIDNIKVNNKYKKSSNSSMLTLQIGDEDKYVFGIHTYVISYDYNLGKDYNDKYDELYFNLIGLEWTTSIEYVSFRIQMPKEFDSSLVGFTSGYEGSTGNNVEFNVVGNVISGNTLSKLKSNQALTIRLQLPDNYFVGEGNIADVYLICGFVVPIILTIVTLVLYLLFGRKNNFAETVEFYPPEGLNSLDLAFVYKGYAGNKDVISLLIYLASKGFVTIQEDEESDKITINKLKDYDGDNAQEKDLMEALFGKKESVTLDSLKNTSFPSKVSAIALKTNKKENKKIYFDDKYSMLSTIITIIGIIALIVPGLIALRGEFMMITVYLFPVIGFLVLKHFIRVNGFKRSIGIFCFMLLWAGAPLLGIIFSIISFGKLFVIANILGLVCAMLIIILSGKVVIRTEEGGKLFAKIKGFRNFLKTAEKERLEVLCAEQPSYFYNILPYAYVLGVSNVWIKKFESLAIEQPDWYIGTSNFSLYRFNRIMTTASIASYPKVSSSGGSSGGGHSGGGFSGGGSGGGGGGRW